MSVLDIAPASAVPGLNVAARPAVAAVPQSLVLPVVAQVVADTVVDSIDLVAYAVQQRILPAAAVAHFSRIH